MLYQAVFYFPAHVNSELENSRIQCYGGKGAVL